MKQGRNELCLCNSGKKYKHCCIDKDKPVKKVHDYKELNEDLALGQELMKQYDAELNK